MQGHDGGRFEKVFVGSLRLTERDEAKEIVKSMVREICVHCDLDMKTGYASVKNHGNETSICSGKIVEHSRER
jgi:hypothetical protein